MDQYFCRETKERYYLLDALRGICILGMVAYHTLFDISLVHPIPIGETAVMTLNVIRDLGACVFILLSGFCFSLGKHRMRRFLVLLVLSAIVSVVTFIAAPGSGIFFGILTFMAFSGAILWALERPLQKVPPALGVFVSFLLFAGMFHINIGLIGFGRFSVDLYTPFLYRNYLTAFFGFPFPGFESGDYYPIFPWIWICFCGFFLSRILLQQERALRVLRIRIAPLGIIGKYSLPIYLLHQPVIFYTVQLLDYFRVFR